MVLSKRPVIWLILLSCLLILISLPRFNRNDVGIRSITAGGTGHPGDSADYTAMTLYFRDEGTIDELHPPFTYRPLIPFIASLLPFKAMTAINLINLVAMIVATIFIYKILARLGINFTLCVAGCGLFVVSFPTFYYSTIGYIDPGLICLLTIGLYLIFTNRWALFAGLIIVGAFVKETAIILILASAVYLFINRKSFKNRVLILPFVYLMLFTISYFFARRIVPVTPTFGWEPSFDRLKLNISRSRSWLSFILTFGVPGVMSLFIFKFRSTDWFQERFPETATLIAGLFISVLLFSYSMLSATADGRFIWVSYPFTVPLAAIALQEISSRRDTSTYKG